MNLGECKMGVMVGAVNKHAGIDHGGITDVGFIVGLDLNYSKEVVVKVDWADGTQSSIHPGNLELIESNVKTMYRAKIGLNDIYKTNYTKVKA